MTNNVETSNAGAVSYQKGDERNALLGGDNGLTPLELRDSGMRRPRFVALAAVAFTVLAICGISAMSNGPSENGSNVQHRQTKSDKEKWKKQVKKAEEEAKRVEQCADGKYSKHTLKLAYELPFASLFKDNRGEKKFEASDVILFGDVGYAVCDNSWAISRFSSSLTPFSSNNVLIGDPYREEDDSGYEAILHEAGIFYVVRESVLKQDESSTGGSADESYHAIIEEIAINESDSLDYTVQNACECEFEFEGDSKGFEGAISIEDTSNTLVILGLCEGNYCKEDTKDKTGNGRLVAMKKEQTQDGSCRWKTLKQINIPSSADFQDYSAITIDDGGRVAISSQEDSAVWIGQLKGQQEVTGLWDLNKLEFDEGGDFDLYEFPKSTECHTIYCNVEGIHWLDNNMLMAVSDKMKSKGKQDFRCFDKDQSVHAFVVP